MIAQLVIALGPVAFQFIQQLMAVWSKPVLTVEEVLAICSTSKKSYDDYIASAIKQGFSSTTPGITPFVPLAPFGPNVMLPNPEAPPAGPTP